MECYETKHQKVSRPVSVQADKKKADDPTDHNRDLTQQWLG